jgi:hypothetical protein
MDGFHIRTTESSRGYLKDSHEIDITEINSMMSSTLYSNTFGSIL